MKDTYITYILLIVAVLAITYVVSLKTKEGMENRQNLVFVNEEGAYDLGNRGRPLQLFSKKPSTGSYGTPGSGTGVAARPVLPGQGAQGAQVSQVYQGGLLPGTEIQGILPRITSNAAALAAAEAAAAAVEASRAEIEKAKKEAEELRRQAREENEERAKELEEKAKELEERARRLEQAPPDSTTDSTTDETNMEGEFCTTDAACKDNNLFCGRSGQESKCMRCTSYDYDMSTQEYTTRSRNKLPNDTICSAQQSDVNEKYEAKRKFDTNKTAIDNYIKAGGPYQTHKEDFEKYKKQVNDVTGKTQADLDEITNIETKLKDLQSTYDGEIQSIQQKIAENKNKQKNNNSIGEFTNPEADLKKLSNEINDYITSNGSVLNKKRTEIQNAINEETARVKDEQTARKNKIDQVKTRINEKLDEINDMLKKSNNYVATVTNINTQNSVEALNEKIAELEVKIDSYNDDSTNKQKFENAKQFVKTQANYLINEEKVEYDLEGTLKKIDNIGKTIFETNLELLIKAMTERKSKVTRIRAKRKLNNEQGQGLIPDLDELNSTFPTTITEQSINSTSDYGEIINALKVLNAWKNEYKSVDEAVNSYNNEFSEEVKTHIDIQELDQQLTTKYNNVKNKVSEIEELLTKAEQKQTELKNSSSYIKYFFDQAENKDKTLRFNLTPTYSDYTNRAKEFNIGKLNVTSDLGTDYKYYLSQGGYACSNFNDFVGAGGVSILPQMSCQKNINDVRTKPDEKAFHMKVEPNAIAVGDVGEGEGYCYWGEPSSPLCNRERILAGEKIQYSFIEEGGENAEPTIRTKLMDEWIEKVYNRFIAKRQVTAVDRSKSWNDDSAWANGKMYTGHYSIDQGGMKNVVADGRENYTFMFVDRMSQPNTTSPYWYELGPTQLDIWIGEEEGRPPRWETKTFYIIPSHRRRYYFQISNTRKVKGLYLYPQSDRWWNDVDMYTRFDYRFKKVNNIWYLVGNEGRIQAENGTWPTSYHQVRVPVISK